MVEPHRSGCAKSIRHQGIAAGLPDWQIAEDIHRHCSVSLLRAHRHVHGWSLEQVVAKLREIYVSVWGINPPLAHQRVSQWERGSDVPCPRYADALCRLYRTRPDRLGLGRDYTEHTPNGGEAATPSDHQVRSGPTSAAITDEQRDDMDRRQLIRSVALYSGLGAFAPILQTLRASRIRANALLDTQLTGLSSIEDWEQIVHDYGYRRLDTPLQLLLLQMVADFDELQQVLARRQPLEFQRRLYRVAAQLAVLIGVQLNDTADHARETHGWFHTARLAADETGDRHLRAWVIAKEGMTYLWYGRSAERSVLLSRQAQVLAGSQPSVFGSYAASVEARAQARLGRRDAALAAVQRSEAQFQRLRPEQTDANVLGFYEHFLRFHLENALTLLGETRRAAEHQVRAHELSDHDATHSTLVTVDQAACLVRSGEIAEGCRVAARAISGCNEQARGGIVLNRVRDVATLVPAGSRRISEAQELFAVLRS